MKNDRANARPSLHASLNWSFLLLSSWLQERGDRDPMLSLSQQVIHLFFNITKAVYEPHGIYISNFMQ